MDACNIDEEMNNEIVARLLILTDNNVVRIKSEICKSFFLAALTDYDVGDIILLDEMIIKIKNSIKCRIEKEDAIVVIEELIDDGVLSQVNGMKYRMDKKIPINNFSTQVSPIWDEFNTFLKEQMPDYDIYLDRDAKPIFENIILRLLTHVASTSENLEFQLESLQEIDIQKIIENNVSQSGLLPDSAKKFSQLIIEYLRSNSPQLQKLVFNSYYSTICMHIMFQAKSLPSINIVENLRYLVLDTSFLVSLFCKTDPRHPLTLTIVEYCKKRNIPLYYLSKTKDEMWRLIEGSNHEMGGLSSSKARPTIMNQFVEDFINQNEIDGITNWDDYYEFLRGWEFSFNKMTVQEIPNTIKCEINDVTESYIVDTINLVGKEKNRSKQQVAHDAHCIGFVDCARGSISGGNTGEIFGPWFITFDNLLAIVDGLYQRHNNKLGLVLQPRSLLNYFIAYTGVEFDTEDQQMVSEAILKYSMTTTRSKLTIEDYAKLVTYKIGLSKNDINTVKNIILNHPLREQIRRALESNRGDLADASFIEIISDEPFIEHILEYNDQKNRIKYLAKANAEAEAKLREMSIKYETLHELLSLFDSNTQQKLDAIMSVLESESVFEKGIMPMPPQEPTLEKVKAWLRGIKETIDTTQTLSEGVKAALPLIQLLLKSLN
ncbi:hypothetical protein [Methanofollis fontis]|uniref:Uncharacterized protein n=1 Tax=Methanofollis fontis TaxID=2052832 RepID=A0A483CRH8_9EURY|nr:hypothetical protein [Methanofollis fontis]TAJ43634.1 hypothetical protein CUJ86_09820 [Methanofollis fontis]